MSSSGQALVLKPGQSTKGGAPSATPAKKARTVLPALSFSQAEIEAKLAAAAAAAASSNEMTTLVAAKSLQSDQKDLAALRDMRQALPRPNGSMTQRQGSISPAETEKQQATMLDQYLKEQTSQITAIEEAKKQQAARLKQLSNDFENMRNNLFNQFAARNIVAAARAQSESKISANTVRDTAEDSPKSEYDDSPKQQLVTLAADRPPRIKKPRALRKQSADSLTIGYSKVSPKSGSVEPTNAPVIPPITITGP